VLLFPDQNINTTYKTIQSKRQLHMKLPFANTSTTAQCLLPNAY